MSKPKSLSECEDAIEIADYLESHNCKLIRSNGHKIFRLPNNQILPIPQGHRKPLGKGLKHHILKICALAGVTTLVIGWLMSL